MAKRKRRIEQWNNASRGGVGHLHGMETRAQGNVVTGYAALFDCPVEIFPGYTEIIRAGSFKQTIATKQNSGKNDIKILWNHDHAQPLGRTNNGSLELSEDERGLALVWHPGATAREQQAFADIRNGLIDQMSFGFIVIKEQFTSLKKEDVLREIYEIELFEVSPVTFPQCEDTSVTVEQVSREILLEARKNNLIKALQTTIEPLYDDTQIIEPSQDQHSIAEAQAKRTAWLERECALHAMEIDYNGNKTKTDSSHPIGVARAQ